MNSLAYWNGTWLPNAEISIPLEDFGFLMGVTVVERLRTFNGQLYRVEEHLSRLRRSIEIMGWDLSTRGVDFQRILDEFIERNSALITAGDDWGVVVFVTPGSEPSASNPTVCVHGAPLPFHNWASQYENGVEAVTVSVRQIPENCWPAELKCRSRMHYYLADCEANSRQPGAKAILLDQQGNVGEGSTANIVAFFAGRGLVTPPRSKVLPGVSQEVLFEIAASLGIPHIEADLLSDELAAADEVYFTSTSVCMLPVVQIDGKQVGNGQPGAIYQRLLTTWSNKVGLDIMKQAQDFSQRC